MAGSSRWTRVKDRTAKRLTAIDVSNFLLNRERRRVTIICGLGSDPRGSQLCHPCTDITVTLQNTLDNKYSRHTFSSDHGVIDEISQNQVPNLLLALSWDSKPPVASSQSDVNYMCWNHQFGFNLRTLICTPRNNISRANPIRDIHYFLLYCYLSLLAVFPHIFPSEESQVHL